MAQPVFLVAARRSGTTLFRLMLDGHPDVIWQRGWEPVADAVGALVAQRKPVQHLQLEGFDPLEARSVTELRGSIEAGIDDILERRGKNLFGGTVHVRFKNLLDIWPDAKFIHLIRDPRDVSISFLKLGWTGHPYMAADAWETAEREWEEMQPLLQDSQFIDVQYETLVAEPEAELRRVCTFLGIAYSDQLFSYTESTSYSMPKKQLAYRWREQLSEDETRLIEAGRHDIMRRRSYEPAYEDTEYSASQVLRFEQIGVWKLRLRRLREQGVFHVLLSRVAGLLNIGFLNDRVEKAAAEKRRKRLATLEKNY